VSDNARLATFSATALVTVGGALEVERNSKLATLDLPALTKVTKGFSLKYNTAMVAFTAPKLTHIGTADTHNLVVQSTEGVNEDAGAKFIVASCPKKPDGVNCAEASAAGTGGLIPGETYKILAGTGFKETFSIYVDAALPLQPNSKYKIVSGTGYTDVNGATFGCAPVSATCTAATTTSLGNYQPGTGKPTNDNVGTLFETGAVVPFQPTCARSADLGGCVQMLVEVRYPPPHRSRSRCMNSPCAVLWCLTGSPRARGVAGHQRRLRHDVRRAGAHLRPGHRGRRRGLERWPDQRGAGAAAEQARIADLPRAQGGHRRYHHQRQHRARACGACLGCTCASRCQQQFCC
jgi:hypothetical protein